MAGLGWLCQKMPQMFSSAILPGRGRSNQLRMKYYREVAAALFAVETVVQDMGLTFNVGLARANGVHSASKECHDAVRSAMSGVPMYLSTVCSNTGVLRIPADIDCRQGRIPRA